MDTGPTQTGSVDQQFQTSYKVITNYVYEQFKCMDASSNCTSVKP